MGNKNFQRCIFDNQEYIIYKGHFIKECAVDDTIVYMCYDFYEQTFYATPRLCEMVNYINKMPKKYERTKYRNKKSSK